MHNFRELHSHEAQLGYAPRIPLFMVQSPLCEQRLQTDLRGGSVKGNTTISGWVAGLGPHSTPANSGFLSHREGQAWLSLVWKVTSLLPAPVLGASVNSQAPFRERFLLPSIPCYPKHNLFLISLQSYLEPWLSTLSYNAKLHFYGRQGAFLSIVFLISCSLELLLVKESIL